jgi:hypothetical protein
MSAAPKVLERRVDGVILRYDVSSRWPYHDQQKPQPSDLERTAVLKAERALILIELIATHALSDLAIRRVDDALHEIYAALQLKRLDYGMSKALGL